MCTHTDIGYVLTEIVVVVLNVAKADVEHRCLVKLVETVGTGKGRRGMD